MTTAHVRRRDGTRKQLMGNANKSDKLDCKGMNRLQRTGTLPTVWIPPSAVRDTRELPRTRMVLRGQRTQLKNRVHATLAKYGYRVEGASDAFGKRGRRIVEEILLKLPPHTQQALRCILDQLDHVTENLKRIEGQMIEVFSPCPETQWLKTLPGVGDILAVVIWTEVGTIERFGSAEQFASYCGLVPRENSSGGKVRFGSVRRDVNRHLKWAFVEAANSALLNRERCGYGHISRLYQRIQPRRGHSRAKVGVARHLSEASLWMLKKGGGKGKKEMAGSSTLPLGGAACSPPRDRGGIIGLRFHPGNG